MQKKYAVCGIGNALLDLEFEVSEDTLQRAKIQKGVMTLIDADRERVLLEELDGIKHNKACGGSAANTMAMLSQLGSKVFYSCKIGNDAAGDYYYRDLTSKGIDTNLHPQQRPAGITGKCLALITPDADRTMNTFLGITETFSVAELNEEAIAQANYLYIEGYLVAAPSACSAAILAAKTARQNHTKIALTLSDLNMVKYFKPELLAIIDAGVDLLFCNEKEALAFTDCCDLMAAQQKLQQYAKKFVITRSNHGSLIYDGNELYSIAAYEAHAVDATGAGDVYAGAFLYSLTINLDFPLAGDIASLAAAKVVTKFGPRLDAQDIHNIQEHIQKYIAAQENVAV